MDRNAVGWFEIYVDDMARAIGFYEAVFDLKLQRLESPVGDIEMMAFPMGDDLPGATGALAKMEGVPPGCGGTIVYFSCEDCAVEAARAADNGGEVEHQKFAIGEYGFVAIVRDTEGNTIGLHSLR
ncbi:MAG: VOC family protein [Gammaproteobacteria bacterium]|nr:VOC family protein [Gammaproteobacteria bacterium]